MLGQKNKTHIVVGKDLALLTSSQTRADLAAGKIGVFKNGVSTATTDALAAGDSFKVVYMNVDSKIIESPVYNYSQLKQKNAVNYAAGTEQKSYVGYNGTTGSITAANSDIYHIHLVRKDWSSTWGEHANVKLVAAYESDATATQTEIADALVTNAARTLLNEKQKSGTTVTKVGRINAATVTAANDLVNNATVVNGSKVISSSATAQVATVTLTGASGTANIAAAGGLTKLVTFGTDLDTTAAAFVTSHAAAYAAVGITVTSDDDDIVFTAAVAGTAFTAPTIANASGDLAGSVAATQANVKAFQYAAGTDAVVVGDYVRIGSVGGGTALTSNVYKVAVVSGTTGTATITLDIEVLEASGTYAAATSDIEVIPAATAAAANWGLMFQSAAVKFSPGMFKYQNVTFDVTLSEDFGSTLVTENTSAYKGIGTYREVAEVEWELRGNRGEGYKVASFPVSLNLNAQSDKTYDLIYLHFEDDSTVTLDGRSTSFHSMLIATEDASGQNPHTGLETIFGIS